MNFNSEELKDKIYACWTGKNLGGTVGAPYEGMQDILDIKEFSATSNEPLPNDDLDLQLVWLKALEEQGTKGINALVLGEYWMNYISPNWNEYGIGKANMAAGFYPPLSGAMDNHWKNSNGAWIRSEIWACVTPGNPDKAAEYAMEDSCVDHGIAEGTFAEMFTAAMESAAFVSSDFQFIIEAGLSRIPSDCRVAKSISIVREARKEGASWQDARQRVLDDSLKDLGWFQAPANVAFVVIGLLYGENDFKKSVLLALNCGDDTDCTCATVGALFGIIYGTKGIPEDWRECIGDTINTVAVNRGEMRTIPQDTFELSERVYWLALNNVVIKPVDHNFIIAERKSRLGEITITNEKTEISDKEIEWMKKSETASSLLKRKPYSYRVNFIHTEAEISFDDAPVVKAGGSIKFHIDLYNKMEEPADPRRIELEWMLPNGFQVSGPMDIYVTGLTHPDWGGTGSADFELKAGEHVEGLNRIYLAMIWRGRPTVGFIPIPVRGIA